MDGSIRYGLAKPTPRATSRAEPTVPTRAADNADDRTEAEVARSGLDGGGFFFAAAGGDGGMDGGSRGLNLRRVGRMLQGVAEELLPKTTH